MDFEKKVLQVHESIVSALVDFSVSRDYTQMSDILARGDESSIHLLNVGEARELNRLVGAYRDDIALRFPYYDEEHEFYNAEHDDKYDFANVVVVMKVVFAIMAAYPSHFNAEAGAS